MAIPRSLRGDVRAVAQPRDAATGGLLRRQENGEYGSLAGIPPTTRRGWVAGRFCPRGELPSADHRGRRRAEPWEPCALEAIRPSLERGRRQSVAHRACPRYARARAWIDHLP